jgi:hypothetical protein
LYPMIQRRERPANEPPPVESGPHPVTRWRQECLERAGYDEVQATLLASDKTVDLHDAVDLLNRGCPPEVAIQILL